MTEPRRTGFDAASDGLDGDLDFGLGPVRGVEETDPRDSADRRLGAGSSVGQYTIKRLVREGAAGTLYSASDGDGTAALVRVLDPAALHGSLTRERIASDLFTLRGIDHASVSQVLAIGVDGGRPFYALADRGDQTLADAVRQGRTLDELELAWLGRELAGGLAALHRAGLVHGGLAAQTVTLTPERASIAELDWFARVTGGSDDEGPRPDDDVAALARVLCFAATGGPADAVALRRGRPDFCERLLSLIEALEGKVFARPTAARAAHSFAELARELGVANQSPPGVRDLLSGQRSKVDAPPPLGPFGRYVLLEPVARGGTGVIYRARHAAFDRIFAIKVMAATSVADEVTRRRFLREAEVAAALDHPAIARVHDVGEVDGRGYLAMDFTDGRPLRVVCRDAATTLADLVRTAVAVARAVHHAHSRGIVHRDLTPDTILVDATGQPRISDFGTAKRLDDTVDPVAAAGALVGTPAYMAPEQAEGRFEDVDARADVYSLGATLSELVGRWRSDVPRQLDAIVLRATERDPEQRYPSAAALADDLERFLDGRLIHGVPTSARRRRAAALVGVVAVAVVAVPHVGVVDDRARTMVLSQVDALLDREEVRLPGTPQAFAGAGDRTDEARLSFEQALAAERATAEARDRELAARHEADGVRHLEAGDLHAAQASFVRAIALGSTRAEELLRSAEDARVLGRVREAQREAQARQADEARQLAARAAEALERGAVDEARDLFLEALALDGRQQGALHGLIELDRRSPARAADLPPAAGVEELLTCARQGVAQGRRAFRDGSNPDVTREAYFAALRAYDIAATVSESTALRNELGGVGRELSAILRDEGRHDDAVAALRLARLDPGTVSGPRDLPLDPHLAVLEADRVVVRRAFEGEVRFQPTRAFDALRARVARHGGRWRVTILVRSRPTAAVPPAVVCTGVWLRIEDLRSRTTRPTVRFDFEEPLARRVTVMGRCRVIDAFERTAGLDARCLRAIEETVNAALENRPAEPVALLGAAREAHFGLK